MEDERYFKPLDRVLAPPGFEQAVLTKLRERKAKKTRLTRLEFSLAGATALIVAAFIIFSPAVRKSLPPVESGAGLSSEMTPEKVVHLMEPIDWKKEMLKAAEEPQTVFILEQVSDSWIQQIRY